MLFTLDKLDPRHIEVIGRIDDIRDRLRTRTRHARRWTGLLRRSLFARAIRGSNSIEGYNVTVGDAIAAAVGEEPLEADEVSWRAVVAYRNAMTYVLQLAGDPHFSYNENLLRGLHYMMLQYDLSKHPGLWRPGPIFVRDDRTEEIVYEGPDAEAVPELMRELVETLEAGGEMPSMIQAAMAHLNLAMIHPFSDGNGRMARCLQTLVLVREGYMAAEFCSIEEYLGRNTGEYYRVLAELGQGGWHPGHDARPWVKFCLTAHFHQAATILRRIKEYAAAWEELEYQVEKSGLHERVILALHDATFGFRVRNSTYRAAAEISLNLASRDLKQLADAGFIVPKGERRGRYYVASQILTSIRERVAQPRPIEDPFN